MVFGSRDCNSRNVVKIGNYDGGAHGRFLHIKDNNTPEFIAVV